LSTSLDNKLNLLVAYPYMKKPVIEKLVEHGDKIRFLLDSGAFTAWKSGKPIDLDDYCRFIEKLPIKPWRYFTLDVIGDPHASMKNYQTMLDRGFNPIPIFTRGEDVSVIEDYYKTSDVVGLGGLVGTPKNKAFVNAVMRKVAGRRVHWLGFTSTDYIKHYRPYMCDSSSWVMSLTYASLALYDRNGRFVKCSKQDFAKKPSNDVLRLLREYDINPADLGVAGNWKNSGKGDYPIEKAAFRSYTKFQADVFKNAGTLFFMAVASNWQIELSVLAHNFWREKGLV